MYDPVNLLLIYRYRDYRDISYPYPPSSLASALHTNMFQRVNCKVFAFLTLRRDYTVDFFHHPQKVMYFIYLDHIRAIAQRLVRLRVDLYEESVYTDCNRCPCKGLSKLPLTP
jgi:hypothetical protein